MWRHSDSNCSLSREGGRHFSDYPALRAALDTPLANRIPDVESLSTGGCCLNESLSRRQAVRLWRANRCRGSIGRFPSGFARDRDTRPPPATDRHPSERDKT